MHILFITANKKFLDETSEEAAMLAAMVSAAETLHVVILTARRDGYQTRQIGPQAWLYPTNALIPLLQSIRAVRTIRRQVVWQGELRAHIVHCDDPFLTARIGFAFCRRYDRAWIVNLHRPYGDFGSPLGAIRARLWMMPLSRILAYAERVCVFSERVRLYTLRAAAPAQEGKIFSLQKAYDPVALRNAPVTVDIKKKYPAYNFVIVTAGSLGPGPHIALALEVLAGLRAHYPKAGMIFVGEGRLERLHALRAKVLGVQSWVQFEEKAPEAISYFKTANLMLYLASGEAEDEELVRAAAAGCAIIALDSPLARMVIRDGENGFIVHEASAAALVAAIRRFNEVAGLRERFKANSSAFLDTHTIANRDTLTARLRECWTYQEAGPQLRQLEHTPSFDPMPEPRADWRARLRGSIKKHLTR